MLFSSFYAYRGGRGKVPTLIRLMFQPGIETGHKHIHNIISESHKCHQKKSRSHNLVKTLF